MSASAAARAVPSSPIVLACTHTACESSEPTASVITSTTASVSNRMVSTASAPVTASATVSATVAPSAANGRARSVVRFHTAT